MGRRVGQVVNADNLGSTTLIEDSTGSTTSISMEQSGTTQVSQTAIRASIFADMPSTTSIAVSTDDQPVTVVAPSSNSETTISTDDGDFTILGFGVKGDKGEKGDDGADGVDGDKKFDHHQGVPSDTWYIDHGLNKYPSVTVVDSTGTLVDGYVQYIDQNNILLKFAGGFSGVAHLN